MATSRSRAGAISRAQQYFDNKFLDDIARRVAIKTESQKFPDPGAIAECHRYLETEMRPAFENMGFTCKGYDNPVAGPGAGAARHPHRGRQAADGAGLRPRRRRSAASRTSGPRARVRGSPRATAIASMAAAPPTTRASTPSTWRRSRRCWPSAAAASASTPSS